LRFSEWSIRFSGAFVWNPVRALRDSVSGVRDTGEVLRDAVGSTPVVVLNADVDFCPSVLMAADAGMRQAFEHLHALGHRHVAYVPGPASAWANSRRHQVAEVAAVALLELEGHSVSTF
jgi:DNA-binding LacI/PurR family transcriptional regulator